MTPHPWPDGRPELGPGGAASLRASMGFSRMRAPAIGLLVGVWVAVLGEGVALAKTSYDSTFSYKQAFGTALRLLKVDLGYQVSEANPEWGYLLFEFTSPDSGKRKNRGAFEIVDNDGVVQVTAKLPELPSYHEDLLVSAFKRKLTEEHGTPPARGGAKKDADKGSDGTDKKKPDADKPKKGKPDGGDSIKNSDTIVILEPERDSLKKKKSAD
ncbi:MAG: hypothetical protein EXR75_07925 [Myxococcales bacterium]|nr:hypothetical protein [Myxococcales bacterium]